MVDKSEDPNEINLAENRTGSRTESKLVRFADNWSSTKKAPGNQKPGNLKVKSGLKKSMLKKKEPFEKAVVTSVAGSTVKKPAVVHSEKEATSRETGPGVSLARLGRQGSSYSLQTTAGVRGRGWGSTSNFPTIQGAAKPARNSQEKPLWKN